MKWIVKLHTEFELEFDKLSQTVQNELLAHTLMLEKFGPHLGRPWVDTLKGSKYPNMKEMRFKTKNGVWRVAFAYDPKREAILLIFGNKKGSNEKKFYKDLIKLADKRFTDYLGDLKKRNLI